MENVLNQIDETIPKDQIPSADKSMLVKAREQVAILKQKECMHFSCDQCILAMLVILAMPILPMKNDLSVYWKILLYMFKNNYIFTDTIKAEGREKLKKANTKKLAPDIENALDFYNKSIPKEKWETEEKDLVKKAQAILEEINIQTNEIGVKVK